MTNFFNRLEAATQKDREEFYKIELLQDLIKGNVTLDEYVRFLTEAYYHVSETVPLFMAAAAKIPNDKSWLRKDFIDYINEEFGHEKWILSDIRNSGGDADIVEKGKPSIATELMVSYLHDVVERKNPIALLGMSYVLESVSTESATGGGEAIMKSLGLTRKSFSYLFSHGSLDIKHMEGFAEIMDRITDPKDQEMIIHVAKVIFKLYGDIFRTILRENNVKKVA